MTSKLWKCIALYLYVPLCLLFHPNAVCQLTEATLKGTVEDSSGQVIVGSPVAVLNQRTGQERSTTTGADGAFVLPGLAPDTYTIAVRTDGFKTFEQEGIRLNVGQITEINIRLEVGNVEERIEVTAEVMRAPIATEGRLFDSFGQTQILELPVPQRDIFSLPRLSAGATFIPGAASSTKLTNSPVITVNGNRYRGNNYVLDGSMNVNPNNTGEPAIVPTLDSVEEAQIQTGNFSSEFGRGNGSVVNLRTKSGGNEIHGRLWSYHRNAALNARNFFAASKPPQVFNQFGGNAGGPIVKNRTFYFLSYEATRNALGQLASFQVETPEYRNYVLETAPGSVAARLLQDFPAPLPVPGSGGKRYTDQVDLTVPQGTIPALGRASLIMRDHVRFDQYLGRIDHSFHDGRDKLTGRWIAERQRNNGAMSSIQFMLGKALRGPRNPFEGQFGNLNLSHVHVFERAVNDARVSFQTIRTNVGDESATVPDVMISGVGSWFGDFFPSQTRLRTYELRDTLSFDRGKHLIRVGFEFRRIFKGISIGPPTAGSFLFNNLLDFAADRPFRQSLTVDPATGEPAGFPRYLRLYESGLFFQDDWKATSRLTLNLGARHDYFGDAQERDGRLSSIIFGPGSTFNERLASASIGRVDRLYVPQKSNFSVRIGLAYDPLGDGRSSIRSGFGIAYQPHHGQSIAGARALPPDAVQGVLQPSVGIGTTILYDIPVPYNAEFGRGLNEFGGIQSRPGEPPIRTTGFVVNPDIKTQYTMHWFFNVEREVVRNWTVELGYVGTRGVNLERIEDVNRFEGDLLDGIENRINPYFSHLSFVTNGVNSFYHAMTAELRHNLSYGLTLQTNYRWAKWIDNASDTSTGQFLDATEPFRGAVSASCLQCERGLSMFDVPHRFTTSLTWMSRLGGAGTWLNRLGSNWEISSIISAQSGRPFSVWNGASFRAGGDYNADGGGGSVLPGFYDRPNAPTGTVKSAFSKQDFLSGLFSPSIFPAPARGTVGSLGRNTFRGPRQFNVDLAISRVIPLREGMHLQLRAEAYNAFNTVNLYLPNSDMSLALRPDGTFSDSSAFGKSTAAFDPRVMQLGLRFVF